MDVRGPARAVLALATTEGRFCTESELPRSSHSTSSRSSTLSSPSSYSTKLALSPKPRVAVSPRAPPITTPLHHFPTRGLRTRMRFHRGSARSRATRASRCSCSSSTRRFLFLLRVAADELRTIVEALSKMIFRILKSWQSSLSLTYKALVQPLQRRRRPHRVCTVD
jgi:hypothetical protein